MNDKAKAAAERKYSEAVAAARKLTGGNAVRKAAIKAADDQLRQDYKNAR